MEVQQQKEKQMQTQMPHAVVVPFPSQGHINAIMNLALSLASTGIFITVVLSRRLHSKMFNNQEQAATVSEQLKHKHGLLLQFRMIENPQGLPSESRQLHLDMYGAFFTALQSQDMIHLITGALLQLREQEQGPPITCIISDSFVAATYQVCEALALPRVLFWPYCAAASVTQANTELLISKGYIPVKVEDLRNPTKTITCLPGVLTLLPSDIRSFYREQFSSDLAFHSQVYESKMQNKADWVLVNTFEELEGPESIQALSKGYPVQAVGPVFLENFLKGDHISPKSLMKTSLWEENCECMEWLDKQATDSVLYISFGSLTVMAADQLREVALGLKNSGQPFLWVIRPDLVTGESGFLPENYVHEIKERGLLVSWVPQLKVLSHPSVGGFLTHNGWNSTQESISMGVPMIGWPYWSEQFLNSRFSQDVWHVGIDLTGAADHETGIVKSSKIEEAVRRLMQQAEGCELRNRASVFKEAAMKTVLPGGSSHANLEAFILHLKELAKKK